LPEELSVIVGIDELLELVLDPDTRLITGLSPRETENPEGTGFDLRAGKLERLSHGSTGCLFNDYLRSRKTPETDFVCEYDLTREEKDQEVVVIIPGDYYLVQTVERLRVPAYLLGLVEPRTTLFRSGVRLDTSFVAPGYGLLSDDGTGATLTFGLNNMSKCPFLLQMGARIAHLVFAKIEGETKLYRGQWQSGTGRARTDYEKQV
jgi:deoxycytidine triphosphate deaminase